MSAFHAAARTRSSFDLSFYPNKQQADAQAAKKQAQENQHALGGLINFHVS
jgi:hypothetical protein